MRREHEFLRQLISELAEIDIRGATFGAGFRLRRVIYRMVALIKTHLAEEEAYLDVLRSNLSPGACGSATPSPTWAAPSRCLNPRPSAADAK